jgi:hypothetical protein
VFVLREGNIYRQTGGLACGERLGCVARQSLIDELLKSVLHFHVVLFVALARPKKAPRERS